jgi:peptidyl-tRNA hydrolase, PTH1 family
LVVGLGNPGREYERNRHNVGFAVADVVAARHAVRFGRHRRSLAAVGEGRLGVGEDAPRLVIAKPMTYMNLSGGPVAALLHFYKIDPGHLLVIHDELDLLYGQLRAKFGGGEGGHNGLRSISTSVSTRDYFRVRFGIGRPPGRRDPVEHVLSDFTATERKDLDLLVDRSADMVESVITRGLAWTQNAFHAADA